MIAEDGTQGKYTKKNYTIFFQVISSILIYSIGLDWSFERINFI